MSPNQRQFFRCPLTDESSAAVLIVGRRRLDCRLVEMSLGGFAVLSPAASIRLPKDSLACLKVRGLEYIVRITRQETRDGGVLLGLEQVEEVVPDHTHDSVSASGRWLTRAAWLAALSTVVFAVYCLLGLNISVNL